MPVSFDRDVYCLLGLPFDAVDMADTIRHVTEAAVRNQPCFLSTPNIDWIIGCRTDSEFRDSVVNSDLNVADGMPLIWIARMLGIPLRERVAGSNLFENLRRWPGAPIPVFFFGGPDGAAEVACQRLIAEGRGLTCAGFESPGFGSVEDMSGDETIDRINRSNASFLPMTRPQTSSGRPPWSARRE